MSFVLSHVYHRASSQYGQHDSSSESYLVITLCYAIYLDPEGLIGLFIGLKTFVIHLMCVIKFVV